MYILRMNVWFKEEIFMSNNYILSYKRLIYLIKKSIYLLITIILVLSITCSW